MDLLKVLELVATGGAAVAIAWRIIERWPWATRLDPEPRDWAASAIAGVVGALAWLLQMGLGVWPQPVDWQGWVTALSTAFIVAGYVSKKVHTRKHLSKYERNHYGERIEKPSWPPVSTH